MTCTLPRVAELMFSGATILGLVSCSGPVPTGAPPQVAVEPAGLEVKTIDSGGSESEPATDDRPVHVGELVKVSGTVYATDPPNRPVLASFVKKNKQGKPVVHNEVVGSWKAGASPDEWIYEQELEAPRESGTYSLVVRSGDAIVDEKSIEVEK